MYNYYVIEIQTNAPGSDSPGGVIPYGFEDRNAAEGHYLYLRGIAKDSSVYIHTVMWVSKEGHTLEKKTYIHEPAAPAEGDQPTDE